VDFNLDPTQRELRDLAADLLGILQRFAGELSRELPVRGKGDEAPPDGLPGSPLGPAV